MEYEIIINKNNKYAVRRKIKREYEYLDLITKNYWWNKKSKHLKDCFTKSMSYLKKQFEEYIKDKEEKEEIKKEIYEIIRVVTNGKENK